MGRGLYRLVVIIVSWNVKDLLAACLASLPAGADGMLVHTVVVDNASTDGSAEVVRERFPSVELIECRENLGFARANNIALRKFANDTDYFLLLNPDTVISPGALREMVDFMDTHPEAGIAGAKVVKPDGTLDWPCKRSYITPSVLFYKALGLDRLFPRSPRFGRYQLTYLDPDETHEVDSVVGAFLMIRRQCVVAIGPLDESFFMYWEDMDWCYRAKSAGWKIFYVPATTIIHHKAQSTGKRSYQMIYCWYHLAWRVYQKCIAPNYSAGVNCLVWMGFHTMCVVSLIANFARSEKRVPGRR